MRALKAFWNLLFPKVEHWVTQAAASIRENRGDPLSLDSGWYQLYIADQHLTVVFSFEEDQIVVLSMGEELALNRRERAVMIDAIEDWSATDPGFDFFERVEGS
jgi:hypothetical protein